MMSDPRRRDRGSAIRAFRHMNDTEKPRKDACRDESGQGDLLYDSELPTIADDANGERYTQALDRLQTFKADSVKKVWQERRKLDWQQEDQYLRRASKELTKAIQVMLTGTPRKTAVVAPAWGSANPVESPSRDERRQGRRGGIFMGHHQTRGSRGPGLQRHADASNDSDANADGALCLVESPRCPPQDLSDLGVEATKLDTTRLADTKTDGSHLQELRMLVADFVQQHGRKQHQAADSQTPMSATSPLHCQSGPLTKPSPHSADWEEEAEGKIAMSIGTRERSASSVPILRTMPTELAHRPGLVADLLVQARAAHGKAGTLLDQEASTVGADLELSKQAVAALLKTDVKERRSHMQAWVLRKVGIEGAGAELSFDEGTSRQREMKEERLLSEAHEGKDWERKGEQAEGRWTLSARVQDAMVRSDLLSRVAVLDVEHCGRVEALEKGFIRGATEPTSAGSVEAALDKAGGWSADRHFRFLKVVKAAKAVAGGAAGASASIIVRPGRPNGSATVAERLRNNLPEVSAADITRHESWYRLRGLYMTKKNLEKERYDRELNKVVVWGKETLQALKREEAASKASADELKFRERRRTELDMLLTQQGDERERRRQERLDKDEEASREKLCQEAIRTEQKATRDEIKRAAVADYHASLRELRLREEETREKAAKAAEIDRMQRMPKNRTRIGFRKERARQKKDENERRELEAEALEAKRIQVLQKLAASVPYAEACRNAEAKLDHVTAAAAAHFDQFSPLDRSRGHCPMFGFNTKELFRDARFRLGLYLQEAGLSRSHAAHHAVMRAAGPRPDAPF